MTQKSKIDLSKITDPVVLQITKELEKACAKLKLDFFLIGARARDYWLNSSNIKSMRLTNDVDFAVLVPSEENYNELLKILVNIHSFQPVKGNSHRLLYGSQKVIVDILPFGEIEKSGYVHFNDNFDTVISTLGLNEVYQSLIDNGHKPSDLKLASLPGLCLLKIISWNDFPELRKKDLSDLYYLLQYAFDIEEDEIYKSHLDLFDENDFETVLAGCRVMGRQCAPILERSDKLRKIIENVLEENTKDIENSKMGDIMATASNESVERMVQMLKSFQLGVLEKLK